jgi:hypothetical protein
MLSVSELRWLMQRAGIGSKSFALKPAPGSDKPARTSHEPRFSLEVLSGSSGPPADKECQVVLLEPMTPLNTGSARNERFDQCRQVGQKPTRSFRGGSASSSYDNGADGPRGDRGRAVRPRSAQNANQMLAAAAREPLRTS